MGTEISACKLIRAGDVLEIRIRDEDARDDNRGQHRQRKDRPADTHYRDSDESDQRKQRRHCRAEWILIEGEREAREEMRNRRAAQVVKTRRIEIGRSEHQQMFRVPDVREEIAIAGPGRREKHISGRRPRHRIDQHVKEHEQQQTGSQCPARNTGFQRHPPLGESE